MLQHVSIYRIFVRFVCDVSKILQIRSRFHDKYVRTRRKCHEIFAADAILRSNAPHIWLY